MMKFCYKFKSDKFTFEPFEVTMNFQGIKTHILNNPFKNHIVY